MYTPLTDTSQMPYGKYKGIEMANIDANYLLWLYNENKCTPSVKAYIKDNIDALKQELKTK